MTTTTDGSVVLQWASLDHDLQQVSRVSRRDANPVTHKHDSLGVRTYHPFNNHIKRPFWRILTWTSRYSSNFKSLTEKLRICRLVQKDANLYYSLKSTNPQSRLKNMQIYVTHCKGANSKMCWKGAKCTSLTEKALFQRCTDKAKIHISQSDSQTRLKVQMYITHCKDVNSKMRL